VVPKVPPGFSPALYDMDDLLLIPIDVTNKWTASPVDTRFNSWVKFLAIKTPK